jgi:hypothetical protein
MNRAERGATTMEPTTRNPAQSKSVSTIELLPFHPAADIFPLMEGKEFDELIGDIQRRGPRFPTTTHKGFIIDGRNRARACAKLGLKPKSVEFDGPDEVVPRFIISANIHRRHLKPEERRELLKKLLFQQPDRSDRQFAKETGFSHPYVAKVRAECERAGDVETVSTRTDAKGRKQPAKKRAHRTNGKVCGADSEPATIDLAADEYSELPTASPVTMVEPSTAAPVEALLATITFNEGVEQLHRLAVQGLRLTAAESARVADLIQRLRSVLLENSDTSAPEAVAHSVGANGNGASVTALAPSETERRN